MRPRHEDDANFVGSMVPSWGDVSLVGVPTEIASLVEPRVGSVLADDSQDLNAVVTGPGTEDPTRFLERIAPGGRLICLVDPIETEALVRSIEQHQEAWLVTTSDGLVWGSMIVATKRHPRSTQTKVGTVESTLDVDTLLKSNAALRDALDDARAQLQRQAQLRSAARNLVGAVRAKVGTKFGLRKGAHK